MALTLSQEAFPQVCFDKVRVPVGPLLADVPGPGEEGRARLRAWLAGPLRTSALGQALQPLRVRPSSSQAGTVLVPAMWVVLRIELVFREHLEKCGHTVWPTEVFVKHGT